MPRDASFKGEGIPLECDAVGCRELAHYRLEGHWASDDLLLLYVCMVHLLWGEKELKAFRIYDVGPEHVVQYPVDNHREGR